jgi:hypothetical protein
VRNPFRFPVRFRLLANDLRLVHLLPFVVCAWLTERLDPHLRRYWNMYSLRNWRSFRLRWPAYAMALAGWLGALACLWPLVHCLQGANQAGPVVSGARPGPPHPPPAKGKNKPLPQNYTWPVPP